MPFIESWQKQQALIHTRPSVVVCAANVSEFRTVPIQPPPWQVGKGRHARARPHAPGIEGK
eukprot:1329553-Alexandrium_andersonii.AAC.1